MLGTAHFADVGFDPVIVAMFSALSIIFVITTVVWWIFTEDVYDKIVLCIWVFGSIVLISGAIYFGFFSSHKGLVLDTSGAEVVKTTKSGQTFCTVGELEFFCEIKQVGDNKYEIWGREEKVR